MGTAQAVCTGAGALFLLLSLAGCGFCVHAALALRRYAPVGVSSSAPAPDVTLIKPLHGLEPGLKASLESFLRQDHPASLELRLGLQSPTDPALQVAQALAAQDGRVRVVLDTAQHGANRKVSNLINLERAAPRGELVVQSDSDVAVGPRYLSGLAAALAEPGVGVASCLYYGEAALSGLAARLAAMGVSYGSLPLFAVGVSTGATPCMGSTIALRRETLEAIGGFASVKDVLADDYALGARVRALGLRSVVPPFLVAHRSGESRLTELWSHELRWGRTVREINGWGYLGSVVAQPVPLALLGWLLAGSASPPGAAAGALVTLLALTARLWLKGRVDAVARANGQAAATGPWWLMPVRDMLSFAVFFAALFTRRVEWRGARFHVGADGELEPV